MAIIRPKKSLGQHFLNDDNIARKIVDSLPEDPENLIEIGPGTGMLTKYILRKDQWVTRFIETDAVAVAHLKKAFPEQTGSFIHDDFLKVSLNDFFNSNFQIIGNFPYNISSQIFFRILKNRKNISSVVCMVQKEVARRIASIHGNKTYGILSVLIQTYYTTEYLFTVPEHVFTPPPKVKSGVMRMTRLNRDIMPEDEVFFITFVKTAFNQRRKTLRNALSSLGKDLSILPAEVLKKRAEELSVEEFIGLSNQLH